MKDFLFGPEQARTPVDRLSGGERGRLTLARALALPSNLLVLDEPTNDLDLETLDLLQEMIADYPGTVLVVSHDRDFLDRSVNAVVMSEGEGRWLAYAGGYSDMVAQRGAGVADRAAAPVSGSVRDKSAPTPSQPAAARRKLSFRDKHALDTLPKRMDELRASMQKIRVLLDDPTLYSRDPDRFAKASQAFTDAESELATAEDQWLELEILREELGG
jgi:ATP-binding cassette subfamily F protein uup